MTARLLCTVRGCRRPLVLTGRNYGCDQGHSFDIARSGYVNLLQPQERRSRNPGDSAEAVAARRRIVDAGIVAPLLPPMIEMLKLQQDDALLDVGCGEGYHLAAFRDAFRCEAHGTDISTPAIDLAARRYRDCHWTVANADRFLPYADGSFAALTSITSRINASEFERVLAARGKLLVALPAPDDLIELREAILGEAKLIERADRTVKELRGFSLAARERVRHMARLSQSAIADIMTSSYRALRRSQTEKLATLGSMNVTLSRDLLLFHRS